MIIRAIIVVAFVAVCVICISAPDKANAAITHALHADRGVR